MSQKRAYAKKLLKHYISLAAGADLTPECEREIEAIIDATVNAAIEEIRAELVTQPAASAPRTVTT
jgi:hypothetical protein